LRILLPFVVNEDLKTILHNLFFSFFVAFIRYGGISQQDYNVNAWRVVNG